MLVEDTVTLPIQINGKRRSEITVAKDASKEEVEKTALADDAVVKALDGGQPKKVIVVPGRIVNVVVAVTETASDVQVQAGEVSTFTAYASSGSPVATAAARRDAQERLMIALADQIVARLLAGADAWA
jgi:hypothetical protein